MTFQYTLTLDDFTAAQRLHRKPAPGAGARMRERLLFLWIFLGAIAVIIGAVVIEAIVRSATGTVVRESTVLGWVARVGLLWLVYVLLFGLSWFGLSAWLVERRERRAYRRMTLSMMALLLLSLTLADFLTGGATKPPQPPADDSQGGFLAALLPWAVILGYIWYGAFRMMRNTVGRAWASQTHLHHPTTLQLTDTGVRFATPMYVVDYQWDAFAKWRESDELFLLYLSDPSFNIIPKRAMSAPIEVETFRRLLQERVKAVDAVPLGFPMARRVPEPPPLPATVAAER